jgi:hypothetical protein
LSYSLGAIVVLAVALLGSMVHSSLALAQGSIHIGRKDAYVLMSSFHLHVLANLVMVFSQFVNFMLVCLHQWWMVSAKGRSSSSYFAYYQHIPLWIMRKMFSHAWQASICCMVPMEEFMRVNALIWMTQLT